MYDHITYCLNTQKLAIWPKYQIKHIAGGEGYKKNVCSAEQKIRKASVNQLMLQLSGCFKGKDKKTETEAYLFYLFHFYTSPIAEALQAVHKRQLCSS